MPDEYIRQWGDPALYEPAEPVASFDDLLRARAARLRPTLEWAVGDALARPLAVGAGVAPAQGGWLRRLFAFRVSPEDGAEVLVNPTIIWRSEELDSFVEV